MKKIIVFIFLILLLTGCTRSNEENMKQNLIELTEQYEELKLDYDTLIKDYDILSREYDYIKTEYDEAADIRLAEALLEGWAITIYGNAKCSEVNEGVFQIISNLSSTSNEYIKAYHNRFIDGLKNLASITSSSFVECNTIFIKIVSNEYQPIIEYVIYPNELKTDFMISTEFLDVLKILVE